MLAGLYGEPMISISVGGQRIPLEEFRDNWLLEQLELASARTGTVCVRVDIARGSVKLGLTTPGCGGGGGGRPPSSQEARIIEHWTNSGLSTPGWSPDQLMRFLADLDHLL